MVVSMDRWVGKVAIVTGASSGIGKDIAQRLVKEGLQVVGLARREERLVALAEELSSENGKLYPIKADMTKEEDILNAFEWVKENLGPLHILINNAGIIDFTSTLSDGKTETWKNIFDTNLMGLCIGTRQAVQDMRANDVSGHIIHINSIVGHKIPNATNINVYPASKHAVTALTEALRQELNHLQTKIKITSVSPGAVNTEVFEGMPKEMPMLQPEDITDALIYVLSTPPHAQVHELIIKPVGEIM